MTDYEVVLLDIEGTTTPISFVRETLFPFAVNKLDAFVDDSESDPKRKKKLDEHISAFREIKDVTIPPDSSDRKTVLDAFKDAVKSLIAADSKVTPLKSLQGSIWEAGYKDGSLRGPVYDDVVEALKTWQESGVKVYIYSSGSIAAQKLLYGYSEHGDLLRFLSGHFDTTSGHKQEAASYTGIHKVISQGVPSIKDDLAKVLFLSDIVKEVEAAQNAGMSVALLERPGNGPLNEEAREKYRVVQTFKDVVSWRKPKAKRGKRSRKNAELPKPIERPRRSTRKVEQPKKQSKRQKKST